MLSNNETIEEVMMRSVDDMNNNNNIINNNNLTASICSRATELPLDVFSILTKSSSNTTLPSPSTPSSSSTLSSPMSTTNTTLLYNTTSGTLLNIPIDVLNNNKASPNLTTTTTDDQQQQPQPQPQPIAKPHKTTSTPLPEILESIQKASHFPPIRHRWNTNEEIAAMLIALERQDEWLSQEVKLRPKSGSMMLYSRKSVRYRRDGYCWKKRKDGKTTREDHMKLKVQGIECIYGCYVHSAILPTFHRRCYWLLQNPDIVLVHYLNVPYNDDNKIISPTFNYFSDSKKEWTRDDLICELQPMFFNETDSELSAKLESSTMETIEAIVQQLMVRQRAKLKSMEIEEIVGQQQQQQQSTVLSGDNNNNNNTGNNPGGQRNGPKTNRATVHLVGGQMRGNKGGPGGLMASIDVSNNNCHHHHRQHHQANQQQQQQQQQPDNSKAHQRLVSFSGPHPALPRQSHRVSSPVISLSGPSTTTNPTTSVILNLSQLHTANNVPSFILVNSLEQQQPQQQQQQQQQRPETVDSFANNMGGHAALIQHTAHHQQHTLVEGTQSVFYYDHSLQGAEIKVEADEEMMMISSEPATPEPMGTSNNTPRSSPFMLDSMDNFDSIDTFFDVESNMITCNYLVSSYPANRSGAGASSVSTAGRHNANLNLNLLAQQHSSPSSTDLNVVSKVEGEEESPRDMEHFMDSDNITTPDDALFTFNEAFDLFDFDHLVDDHFGEETPTDLNTNHEAGNETRTNLNDQGDYYVATMDKTKEKSSAGSSSSTASTSDGTINATVSHHQSSLSLPGPFSLITPRSPRHDHTLHPSTSPSPSSSSTSSRHRRGRSAVAHTEQTRQPQHPMLDENGNVFATSETSTMASTSSSSSSGVRSPIRTRHYSSLAAAGTAAGAASCKSFDVANDIREDTNRFTNNSSITITDYSPEWCYPEGNIKVLVAGPWSFECGHRYAILFDSKAVPTELVQNGLLRCFSPKHPPGFVSLQVSCDDVIISNAVIFEYRDRNNNKKDNIDCLSGNSIEHCDRHASSSSSSSSSHPSSTTVDPNGNPIQTGLANPFDACSRA